MVQAKSQEAKFMVEDLVAPKILEKPAEKIVDIVAKSISREKVTAVKYNLPDYNEPQNLDHFLSLDRK